MNCYYCLKELVTEAYYKINNEICCYRGASHVKNNNSKNNNSIS